MASQRIAGPLSLLIVLGLAAFVAIQTGCGQADPPDTAANGGKQSDQDAARGDRDEASNGQQQPPGAPLARPDQKPAVNDTPRPDVAQPAEPGPPKDPFAVPEGDARTLLAFIERVQRLPEQAADQEEFDELQLRAQHAVVNASERILAGEVDDAIAVRAAAIQFNALQQLFFLGDPAAGDMWAERIEQLKDDPRPGMASLVQQHSFLLRTLRWDELEEEQRADFVQDLKAYIAADDFGPQQIEFSLQIIGIVEYLVEEPKLARELYETMLGQIQETDDEVLAQVVPHLEGKIRYLSMLGSEMEIEGTLLDGSEFDWKDYEGKVVLVDFWATWCGPCIQELPNVIENYDAYHEKGFDVVGISLDKDAERVEQFFESRQIPWPTLFSHDEEAQEWNHPMVERYGVSGIPAAILVDQQGKVVSLNARGEKLGALLAQLLGPAADPDDPQEPAPPAQPEQPPEPESEPETESEQE